jgi:hypothetical protein
LSIGSSDPRIEPAIRAPQGNSMAQIGSMLFDHQ